MNHHVLSKKSQMQLLEYYNTIYKVEKKSIHSKIGELTKRWKFLLKEQSVIMFMEKIIYLTIILLHCHNILHTLL